MLNAVTGLQNPSASADAFTLELKLHTALSSESVMITKTDQRERGADYVVVVTAQLCRGPLRPEVIARLADEALLSVPESERPKVGEGWREAKFTQACRRLKGTDKMRAISDLRNSSQVGSMTRLMDHGAWGVSAVILGNIFPLVVSPQFRVKEFDGADSRQGQPKSRMQPSKGATHCVAAIA